MRGRVIVVTGGTQGLGLAIAEMLVEAGCSGLALVSRSTDKGEAVCGSLSSATCKVVHVRCDLAGPDVPGVIETASELLKEAGPITGLVNAAGLTARGNLLEETAEGWDAQMAVNVRAPFLLMQAVSKKMIASRVRGSIVNIASVAAKGGAPFILGYSVSKSALVTLTKNASAELAPHGIRANAVNMGWCFTCNEDALQKTNSGPDWLAKADASVPLKRLLRPVDVAATCLFLLSDSSAMMTGSVVDLHPEYADGMISLAPNEGDGR